MWCLSLPSGRRSFHDTEADALSHCDPKSEHVVWFDSFDYARFNRGSTS